MLSAAFHKYGDAPRAARRPPRKARGGRIPRVFDRRATPRGGMRRRPNATVFMKGSTKWGARAAALYSEAYADAYRKHDDRRGPGTAAAGLTGWLREISEQFDAPIDVLDLGCGTGRYFQAPQNVRRLVGIDVSRPMLERARRASALRAGGEVTLVEGDFLIHEFQPAAFDLVYAIGVLAEHSPLDEAVALRVKRWLRPGGRFAFTAVHPLSPSVP